MVCCFPKIIRCFLFVTMFSFLKILSHKLWMWSGDGRQWCVLRNVRIAQAMELALMIGFDCRVTATLEDNVFERVICHTHWRFSLRWLIDQLWGTDRLMRGSAEEAAICGVVSSFENNRARGSENFQDAALLIFRQIYQVSNTDVVRAAVTSRHLSRF